MDFNSSKRIFILTLILIISFLLSIGCVNAHTIQEENNSTDYITNNKISYSLDNDEEIVNSNSIEESKINSINDNKIILNEAKSSTNSKSLDSNQAAYKKFVYDIKHSNGKTVYLNKDIVIKNTIKIENAVTIDGNNHIIDGSSVSKIFKITNNKVTLKNIILKNAKADHGAAIYNEGSLTIDNCQFIDNVANYKGGAIYSKGKLNIYNSKFLNNKALLEQGGAIYCTADSNIINCEFKGNSAKSNTDSLGGAIHFNSGNHYLSGCTFSNNQVKNHGGAIFAYKKVGYLKIDNCIFKNNKAKKEDGGSISFCGKKLIVTNSRFTGNYAYEDGGAIDTYSLGSYSVKVNINHCEFKSNTGRKSAGSIYLGRKTKSKVKNSKFKKNKSNVAGALYIEGKSALVSKCVFTKNFAKRIKKKKALSKKRKVVQQCGGSIYNKCFSAKILKSKFKYNSAEFGGAIFNRGFIKVYKNFMTHNKATYGGGFFNEKGRSTIIKNIFRSNRAKITGAGLTVKNGKLKVKRNMFLYNKARVYPEVYCRKWVNLNYNWWKHTLSPPKKGPSALKLTNLNVTHWLNLKTYSSKIIK